MAERLTEPTDIFCRVTEAFWPGPLTVIARAASSLRVTVTAGTNTVGLRWPIAPFATKLVEHFRNPITATSANRSGMPSAVTAEDVRRSEERRVGKEGTYAGGK